MSIAQEFTVSSGKVTGPCQINDSLPKTLHALVQDGEGSIDLAWTFVLFCGWHQDWQQRGRQQGGQHWDDWQQRDWQQGGDQGGDQDFKKFH